MTLFFGKCPEQNYTDNYLSESFKIISEGNIDRGVRDQKFHLNGHRSVSYDGFLISETTPLRE